MAHHIVYEAFKNLPNCMQIWLIFHLATSCGKKRELLNLINVLAPTPQAEEVKDVSSLHSA